MHFLTAKQDDMTELFSYGWTMTDSVDVSANPIPLLADSVGIIFYLQL